MSERATPKPKRASRARASKTAEIERNLLDVAESLVVSERRLERSPRLGPRAEATRRKLIDSSAELFRTNGYADTTVADIAKHAQVSLPTFYQYFSEINDVIAVIVVDFIKDSMQRGVDQWDVAATGRAGLERWIEAFLKVYIDYADLMELWECAKLMSPKIRALSKSYSDFYVHRFERLLQDGVDRGVVRADLPAARMAEILVTTMQYYAYERYVLFRSKPGDLKEPVQALTEMIASALQLSTTS